MIVESLDERYVDIGHHMKSMFNAWCVKEVAELWHFITYPWRNWMYDGDKVSKCVVLLMEENVFSSPSLTNACMGTFYVSSVASKEHSVK